MTLKWTASISGFYFVLLTQVAGEWIHLHSETVAVRASLSMAKVSCMNGSSIISPHCQILCRHLPYFV